MSSSIGFGEYEALLPCDCVNAALTFSRELFSREYVVQRVTRQVLAVAVKEGQWRGLARIHTGHLVQSVDGVPVRGLSSRQFAELWYPPTSAKLMHRRVRFRDRKRAELEVEMQKEWTSAGPIQFTPVQDDTELQNKLQEVHELIWAHELTEAHRVLRSLPVGSDPMVCLLAAELEVVRVLVSKDALYLKQAQRAANQAVTWLESLYELPSQSYTSRKRTQLVLAEVLFLSALLRLGRDQRLTAITTARRCAGIYVELHEKFWTSSNAAKKREKLLMPENELQTFQKRIRFGVGVLHVGGALALQKSLDWIGTLLKGACDIKKGIEFLLDCSSINEGSLDHAQANWSALTLMHCAGAIRLIQHRNEQGIGDQLFKAITAHKQIVLQRHPKALVFLWSEATTTNFDGNRLKHLEGELARVSAVEERVHLVRFDVGYRYFLARKFDGSSVQFMAICKCASAPTKLRGLSSLFLAVGYLLMSHEATEGIAQDAKLLNSVRLLLRSARRFLALRLEDKAEDFESASLYERLGDYLDRNDEYLQLLPWEILYVYFHPTKTFMTLSSSDVVQHQRHVAALEQLNRLSKLTGAAENCDTSKQNYDAEITLIRAIVLFNLRELDDCGNELQKLWSEILPQGCQRPTSPLGRLLNQRPSHPPSAFIAPVAWFYQLRILLERRCSSPRSTLASIEKTVPSPKHSNMDTSQGAVSNFAGYPYHYVYNGKLQAMNKLVTRLANGKVDNDCSSPTASNFRLQVLTNK